MFAWVCPRWVTAQAEGGSLTVGSGFGPIARVFWKLPYSIARVWGQRRGRACPHATCLLPFSFPVGPELAVPGKQGSRECFHSGRTGPEERGGELGLHPEPCLQKLWGKRGACRSRWAFGNVCLPRETLTSKLRASVGRPGEGVRAEGLLLKGCWPGGKFLQRGWGLWFLILAPVSLVCVVPDWGGADRAGGSRWGGLGLRSVQQGAGEK